MLATTIYLRSHEISGLIWLSAGADCWSKRAYSDTDMVGARAPSVFVLTDTFLGG